MRVTKEELEALMQMNGSAVDNQELHLLLADTTFPQRLLAAIHALHRLDPHTVCVVSMVYGFNMGYTHGQAEAVRCIAEGE